MSARARWCAAAAPGWLALAALLSRCNLYEGRSLDLFQAAVDLAAECRDSRDCPRDRKFCARDSCVQCLLDADCDRRHPACVGNACVECRSAEDCAPGQNCNSVLNVCAPACTLGSDCTGPELGHCSSEQELCVQCLEDVDCSSPKDPVCGRGGRCVGCRGNADCAPDAGKPACDLATQRCGQCTDDSQCEPSQTCDIPAARCTPMPMPMPMPMSAPAPMPPVPPP